MDFYKLQMDRERNNDILAHYEDDFGIYLTEMVIGKRYEGWDGRFTFFYDQSEGSFPSDYLANDKGWFVVSDKLKRMMESLDTEINTFRSKFGKRTVGLPINTTSPTF